jgi:hypothetical protein
LIAVEQTLYGLFLWHMKWLITLCIILDARSLLDTLCFVIIRLWRGILSLDYLNQSLRVVVSND